MFQSQATACYYSRQELRSCSLEPGGPDDLEQEPSGSCVLGKGAGESYHLKQELGGSSALEPAGLHYLRQDLSGSCVLKKEPAGPYDPRPHGSYALMMEMD